MAKRIAQAVAFVVFMKVLPLSAYRERLHHQGGAYDRNYPPLRP